MKMYRSLNKISSLPLFMESIALEVTLMLSLPFEDNKYFIS
jgi:hypothetical protein